MYLISSCLAGVRCRYDGSDNGDDEIIEFMKEGDCIIACPEVLGGLDTPRVPCEILNVDGEKHVVNREGKDLTEEFMDGAHRTLEICRAAGVTAAILKFRSPSCGFGRVYDGTFSGELVEGNGLAADLLHKNGIKIYSENNWKEILDD